MTSCVSTEQVEYSISLAGYFAGVCFPGQVRCKFNTQVGMVVDFLKLNSRGGISSWVVFLPAGNLQ